MPANDASQRQQAAADRRLRDQIRAVAERANVERDDLVDLSSNKLEQELTTLNSLLGQIQRPREHAEDAEAFGVIAQRGLESSRLLAAGGKFRTPRALAARLKAAFGVVPAPAAAGTAASAAATNTSIDWEPLARLASSLFRFAPGLSCALGPLDAPRKRVAARTAPRRRATPPPVAGPTVRGAGGGDGDGGLGVGERRGDGPAQETDRRMEAMHAELARVARRAAAAAAANGTSSPSPSPHSAGSVRAIEAVLDHSSFATTVENLFALSFLIRDGFVALSDSAEGYRVRAVMKKVGGGKGGGGGGGGGGAGGAHAAELPGAGGAAGARGNGTQQQHQHHQQHEDQQQHRQLVLAYSPADFEEWKRAVDPRDCLMPKHQASLSGNNGNGAPAAPAPVLPALRAPAPAAPVPPAPAAPASATNKRRRSSAAAAAATSQESSSSDDDDEGEKGGDAPARKRARGAGRGVGARSGGPTPRPSRK